jgi:hypothetical protein
LQEYLSKDKKLLFYNKKIMQYDVASLTPCPRRTPMIHTISLNGRLHRLLLAVALLLTLAGCQVADALHFSYANATAKHHWADEQQTTEVPFTLVDNHILLPVSLNGSEPLQFVLDSGAAANVIIDSRVGTGPDPVAHVVPDTTVEVGALSLAGTSAIFLSLDSIPFFADLDQVYFDGVIGAPFFTRFLVEIDYDRQRVRFTEPSAAPESPRDNSDWRSVPLAIESGVPYMAARVDSGLGEPADVKLLVDTGFRGALSLTPDTSVCRRRWRECG